MEGWGRGGMMGITHQDGKFTGDVQAVEVVSWIGLCVP